MPKERPQENSSSPQFQRPFEERPVHEQIQDLKDENGVLHLPEAWLKAMEAEKEIPASEKPHQMEGGVPLNKEQ